MVTPVLDAVSQPVDTISCSIEQAESFTRLSAENQALREQNARLLQWQAVARRLEAENAALRDLKNMVPDPAMSYLTARVVADPAGAFVRTVLINAGARTGVAKVQAAITGDGLSGRISAVGQRSARALLLTVITRHVPALVGYPLSPGR